MTDTSPADRYAWRTTADYRDEETRSDALVRARAAERNAGWVRFATLMLVTIGVFQIVGIVLAVVSAVGNIGFLPVRPFTAAAVILVIYGITVHGGREGTRFYADRA